MNRTSRRPRPGFTLVELLVVLAIIALLMSLTTAAYQRVRLTQMVRASENTVGKIQTGLDNQVKVIADNVRREQQNQSPDFAALLPFCNGDSDRTAALLLYCRLKQSFPTTSAELSAASFSVGGVAFPRPLAFAGLTTVTDPNPDNVAAAVLYASLQARTQGGNTFASDEALAGAILDIPVATGGPVRVFKDGWGIPISFQRFWMCTELDNPPFVKGGATANDPFDIWGKLSNPAWTNRAAAETQLGYGAGTLFNNRNKTIVAYSYGINKTGELAAPNSGDDIIGYRLRSIGALGAKP